MIRKYWFCHFLILEETVTFTACLDKIEEKLTILGEITKKNLNYLVKSVYSFTYNLKT